MKTIFILFFFLSFPFLAGNIFAEERIVNLTVAYKTVNFAGKSVQAIAVNGQIPAPTLHFREGDHVTINVYNALDKTTAIHWHGIIVPWQMDGVQGVSQYGIAPHGVFHYKFTLHQAGTYWYHAHAGLQEQQGLYGAFIIDPKKPTSYKYTKDYTIILSDWSNTHPDSIMTNLKKEGDYYSPNFPLQPSLLKFIHDYRHATSTERISLLEDYKMMQQMRMSPYDMSDVAYDGFLLNGQPKFTPWTAPVKVGDTVRLRFIDAGASTLFHVKIPGADMQMVHIEGNDIRPYRVKDFTIAPGETYDVLVKISKKSPYIIYAESIDKTGVIYGALLQSSVDAVDYHSVRPFPEPKPVTREMMTMMMGKLHKGLLPSNHKMIKKEKSVDQFHDVMADMTGMDMREETDKKPLSGSSKIAMSPTHDMENGMQMDMPLEPTIMGDYITPPNNAYITTVGTKYENMVAAVKTNNPDKPISGVIRMQLFGYMDRYVWFINGLPEYRAHPIVLQPGKRYRIIFTNTSMMHHPMHIHGHWFILRKGDKAYDPLLHTIDIPPGTTVTADVDTDVSGQWIFHCHLLYHMLAGMARDIQYSSLLEIVKSGAKPQHVVTNSPYINRPVVRVDDIKPTDVAFIHHPMAHADQIWAANFFDAGINPVADDHQVMFKGLYGGDYNKLELVTDDTEIKEGKVTDASMDVFYWHLLDQFWSVKGGINYFYRPAITPYWQPGAGIEGLLPYFIDTDVRSYYHAGSIKLDVELLRDTQIGDNFFVRLGVDGLLASKTVAHDETGSGLEEMRYILRPYYRLMPGINIFAEYQHDRSYGAFKTLQAKVGESGTQNTLTFGLSILF